MNMTTTISSQHSNAWNLMKFAALMLVMFGALVSMAYFALIQASAPGFFASLAVAGFVYDPLSRGGSFRRE